MTDSTASQTGMAGMVEAGGRVCLVLVWWCRQVLEEVGEKKWASAGGARVRRERGGQAGGLLS